MLSLGTVITMANGNWKNVELRLKGQGTEDKPIKLQAQIPGKVIISGQSNLAFSGAGILKFRAWYLKMDTHPPVKLLRLKQVKPN